MLIIYYYILLFLILLNIFLNKITIIKNYISIFLYPVLITESFYIDSDMLWLWYDRCQVAKAYLKTDKQILKNLSALP